MEVPINHHFVPVKDVLTQVLGIPARPGAPPQLQVLIVPGNPGNAGFYRQFIRTLHHALGGRAHVLSCSHAGHDVAHSNTGQQLWDLEEQIQHKVDFISQHLLLPGRPPLVVLAHSIGSYMAVHAVHRLEEALGRLGGSHHSLTHYHSSSQPHHSSPTPPHVNLTVQLNEPNHVNPVSTAGLLGHPHESPGSHDGSHGGPQHEQHPRQLLQTVSPPADVPPISKVVALMPFFEANLSGQWRQRVLHMLAHRYRSVSAAAGAISALPLSVRMGLINWWTWGKMSQEAVRTTSHLLHPACIRNNFWLALSEFQLLARPFQWDLLSRLGTRLHVLACPRDVWMSTQQYQDMQQRVPGLQASWHDDLQHAFCVSQRECEQVTHHVVNEILGPHMAAQGAVQGPGSIPQGQGISPSVEGGVQRAECAGAGAAHDARAPVTWLQSKI